MNFTTSPIGERPRGSVVRLTDRHGRPPHGTLSIEQSLKDRALGFAGTSAKGYSVEKLARRDPERLRKFMKHGSGRIADAALDARNIGPMQAALFRKLLLRPALDQPVFANVLPNAAPDIHGASASYVSRLIYRR